MNNAEKLLNKIKDQCHQMLYPNKYEAYDYTEVMSTLCIIEAEIDNYFEYKEEEEQEWMAEKK